MPAPGSIGIGHTRWATHGAADRRQRPPAPRRRRRSSALVHNGVIENFLALKERLRAEGYDFRSATDTEVDRPPRSPVAWRRCEAARSDEFAADDPYALLLAAVQAALAQASRHLRPGDPVPRLARRDRRRPAGQPAGDRRRRRRALRRQRRLAAGRATPTRSSIWPITRSPSSRPTRCDVIHRDHGRRRARRASCCDIEADRRRAGRLSALHAQGNLRAARDRSRTRCAAGSTDDDATAVFGGLNLTPQQLRVDRPHRPDRLRHELARGAGRRVPDRGVRPHSGRSRVRQRAALSQSAAATEHAAVRDHAKRRDGRHAGRPARDETQGPPDAGDLQRRRQHDRPRGRRRHLSARRAGNRRRLDQGVHVAVRRAGAAGPVLRPAAAPELSTPGMRIIERLAGAARHGPRRRSRRNDAVRRIAGEVLPTATTSCTSAGSTTFPTALEGALKLKEISYIHAEGYPAAEMKHGPIALVDEHTPSVFLMPQGLVYDKVMSNLEEIKARGGPVIADRRRRRHATSADLADDVIHVPDGRRLPAAARHGRSRCNCWPTTSPCSAAATSTSRGTWRRA